MRPFAKLFDAGGILISGRKMYRIQADAGSTHAMLNDGAHVPLLKTACTVRKSVYSAPVCVFLQF